MVHPPRFSQLRLREGGAAVMGVKIPAVITAGVRVESRPFSGASLVRPAP